MSLLGCALIGWRFLVKANLKQIITETLAEQCSKCLDNEEERAQVAQAIMTKLASTTEVDDSFSADKERFMAP
tara:strand:+ start:179 stop:397 length:219 start_codon:yes stop_codon:yes gene_type:complete